MALAQLNGRWKMPCVFAAIQFAVYSCLSYAARYNDWFKLAVTCAFGILEVAMITVSLKLMQPEKKMTFDDFFEGLEKWVPAILGILWFWLWVLLWMLLFIFPAIVKMISYMMMFWVIAENPKISVRKAMRISKIMTSGHKADLFCLMLSFLGWILIAVCTLGIGYLFFAPYFKQTMTNAYFDLKKMAFDTGVLKPADFDAKTE